MIVCMEKKYTFSIIIPIYNSENYIERCLLSVLNQNFDDYECILVDDGSTDRSLEICKSVINERSNFQIFSKENGGVSSARNFGLKRSNGKFILFLDSDDWLETSALQKLSEYTIQNQLIQFGFYSHNNNNVEKRIFNNPPKEIISGDMTVVWRFCFPFEIIKNVEFDETLNSGEDYLFCSKVFLANQNVINIPDCLYNHIFDNPYSLMNKISFNSLCAQTSATLQVEKLINELISENNRILFHKYLRERKKWCALISLEKSLNLFNEKENYFIKKIILKLFRSFFL